MPRLSAGLLMYRIKDGTTEVLLAQPDVRMDHTSGKVALSVPLTVTVNRERYDTLDRDLRSALDELSAQKQSSTFSYKQICEQEVHRREFPWTVFYPP